MKQPITAILLLITGALSAQSSFWTENFTNNIPAGWTSTDGSNQNVVWKWCANNAPGCTPLFGGIDPFQAATAATGYVYVNSDAAGQLGQNHVSRLTTAAINCTGRNQVYVQFQSHIGNYQTTPAATAELRVSTNLTTWTKFEIFKDLTTPNQFSANPYLSLVNISAIAANKPTVYLQWQWTANYDYMWNLDDIALFDVNPTPEFDLAVGDFLFPASSLAQPASQIATDTFRFGAEISNNGTAAQTSIVLRAAVAAAGGAELFADSILIPSLAAGIKDTFFQLPRRYAPALPVGEYRIRYSVRTNKDDGRPGDNVAEEAFFVTDDLFSKENGQEFSTGPVTPGDWYIANLYRMRAGSLEKYKAVTAQFSCASPDTLVLPVRDISAAVYLLRVSDHVAPDFSDFDAANFFSDSTQWVGYAGFDAPDNAKDFDLFTVDLTDQASGQLGVPLEAGARYLLAVGYSGPSSAAQHVFNDNVRMFFVSTLTYGPTPGGASQWFRLGFGPEYNAVIRMTISLVTTVDEKPLPESTLVVYPNPVRDAVHLAVRFDRPTDATITIADANGRVIRIEDRQALMQEILTCQLPDLASGTYLARIATKDGTLTKAIVIQR